LERVNDVCARDVLQVTFHADGPKRECGGLEKQAKSRIREKGECN
jgi:hypothetical protein